MRVQDSSRAGHPRDREMDRSFRRRPAAAANNPRGFVHFEDLLGRQAGLVQSRGRNGQAKRLPPDHHAEVSACAERPSARMKASSNFGQGSGKLGESRAAGTSGTRRRLFLARKVPKLLPFHNRGLSHAPMRPQIVADPDGGELGNLPPPPFVLDLSRAGDLSADLRIEGFLAGKLAITKSFSGKGVDQKFELRSDESELLADGADTTRVVFRVTDEFGAVRPYATGGIAFEVEGPAEIIGENPFGLVGGVGAIWIRAKHAPGNALLRAKHPFLGTQEVRLRIDPADVELL